METFALDLLSGQTLSILLLLGVAPHSLEALRTRQRHWWQRGRARAAGAVQGGRGGAAAAH